MSKVFVIAELACTWLHGGLEAAYRGIRAAKECGADAAKFQWTSDPIEMGKRRGMDGEKYRRLAWPYIWHDLLKAECDRAGIEYLCTVFTPEDVKAITPYVQRFKVSAFESLDNQLLEAVEDTGKPSIVSLNPDNRVEFERPNKAAVLHCVSKYPTPVDELRLVLVQKPIVLKAGDLYEVAKFYQGVSDHTTSVLTGAVAVGAGARIIEKHVRLSDTPGDDPDYGHSLLLDKPNMECFYCTPSRWCKDCSRDGGSFAEYVSNIREAERML